MLIRPACGARATGRAPATRLLLNFASVFTIPALIVVGMKLLSLLFVASQAQSPPISARSPPVRPLTSP